MFNNDSINRLSQALSEQSNNIIIIASEDQSVISKCWILQMASHEDLA